MWCQHLKIQRLHIKSKFPSPVWKCKNCNTEPHFPITTLCLAIRNTCSLFQTVVSFPHGHVPSSLFYLIYQAFKGIWEIVRIFWENQQTPGVDGCGGWGRKGRFGFRSWQLGMWPPEMESTGEGTGLRSTILGSLLDRLNECIIKLISLPVRCY